MSDPFEVDGATAPYESIYTVVLREQELSEIGPILSCNPCNQCFTLHLLGSSVLDSADCSTAYFLNSLPVSAPYPASKLKSGTSHTWFGGSFHWPANTFALRCPRPI